MKNHVFIANRYDIAKYMLEECVGNFYVKDLIRVEKRPFLKYIFSGDNSYTCTSISFPEKLRGKTFETIYLHENVSYKFMKEVLPSLHYKNIYYYYTFEDIRNV